MHYLNPNDRKKIAGETVVYRLKIRFNDVITLVSSGVVNPRSTVPSYDTLSSLSL